MASKVEQQEESLPGGRARMADAAGSLPHQEIEGEPRGHSWPDAHGI